MGSTGQDEEDTASQGRRFQENDEIDVSVCPAEEIGRIIWSRSAIFQS
jgi:hypothetical protein